MNKPCGECEVYEVWPLCPDSQGQTPRVPNCPKYAKYLGYQEGLAEAESRVKAREGTMDFDTFVKALYSAGWRAPNDAQHKGAKSLWSSIQSEAESKVKAREREIVEWLLKEEFRDAASWMEGIRPKESLNKRLEDWLRKE